MKQAAAQAARTIVSESLRGGFLDFIPSSGAEVIIAVDAEDKRCSLAAHLLEGYVEGYGSGGAKIVTFSPDNFLQQMEALREQHVKHYKATAGRKHVPAQVAVLIQSGAFQNELKAYRLRLRLTELGFNVAEHCHLSSMSEETAMVNYAKACGYSPHDALKDGNYFSQMIDAYCRDSSDHPADVVVHTHGGHQLRFRGGMEKCKANNGYYEPIREKKPDGTAYSNPLDAQVLPLSGAGGTYPIGEVITEAASLDGVDGVASCFAFPTTSRVLSKVVPRSNPFLLHVKKGIIEDVSGDVPTEFMEVLEIVRKAEGEAMVRELGLGLNPFLGRKCVVPDVTAFERQLGVHVSMGKRHPLFVKNQNAAASKDEAITRGQLSCGLQGVPLKRKEGKYHFDLFLDAEKLSLERHENDPVCRSGGAGREIWSNLYH